jgi:cation:H+ antiporter
MALLAPLFITLLLLGGIVWACAIFTNAIEWLGHRLKLSEGAVGSLLAAVGTALPETLVPVVALIGGALAQNMDGATAAHAAQEAEHIGIGAILGAPFLLSTLAFCLAGGAVIYFAAAQKRGLVMHLDLHLFKRDLNYFFPAYALVFLAGMFHIHAFNIILALALVAFYGFYTYRTLKIEHIPDDEFHLEPLTLAPGVKEPGTHLILLQTALGLLGIILMAHLFVQQIGQLSSLLGISSLLLSLVITPIATELPEKFNSIVWLSRKKDNLAMANITGAMVFQSCIPTAIGLVFTPWVLDEQGQLSVLLCFVSAGLVYASIGFYRRLTPHVLLWGGLFYLVFLFYSVVKAMQG